MKGKAQIYARVSKGASDESLFNQLQACKQKAAELNFTNITVYIDKELSMSDTLPQLNKLLTEYKPGDVIIALAADRLTRDMSTLIKYRDNYNIKFVEGEPETAAIESILAACREFERR